MRKAEYTHRCRGCDKELSHKPGRGDWPQWCAECNPSKPVGVRTLPCSKCARPVELGRAGRRPAVILCGACKMRQRLGTCLDCGTVVVGGKAGRMPQRCPKCQGLRDKLRNRQRYHEPARKRHPTLAGIKDTFRRRGCVVCGINQPRMVDIHHVDAATKSRVVSDIWNADHLLAELAKCVPLCRNHHGALHFAMHNGGKGLPFDELIEYVKCQYPTMVDRCPQDESRAQVR